MLDVLHSVCYDETGILQKFASQTKEIFRVKIFTFSLCIFDNDQMNQNSKCCKRNITKANTNFATK